MYTKRSAFLLILIVAAGVAVRCHGISERTFWFDEAFSNRMIADFSWGEMIERTGRDVHPPLYYIALRIWSTAFGDAIITLRLFSVVMAALTLVGLYHLVFEAAAYGRHALEPAAARAAGLSASALLASTTLHIYWSQEARMYTLGTALVAWSSWLLLRAVRRGGNWWYVGYVLTAAGLMYTHNYGLFTVLGQGVFLTAYFAGQGWNAVKTSIFQAVGFFRVERCPTQAVLPPVGLAAEKVIHDRYNWRKAAVAMLAVGAAYCPWLPVLLRQTDRVSVDYWIGKLTWWTLPDASQQLLFPVNAATVPDHVLSVVCAVVVVMTLVILAAWRSRGTDLLALLVAVPVVVSVAISLAFVPIVHARYYQFAYVAGAGGFAIVMYRLMPNQLATIMMVLFVFGAVGYTDYFYRHELQVDSRPGIKGAVAYLRENVDDEDIVVVTHPCIYYSVRRYLRGRIMPLLFLGDKEISHYMGSPILSSEQTCGAEDLKAMSANSVWVVSTTGYSLNWSSTPLPFEWRERTQTRRTYQEVLFFQGRVNVFRCDRERRYE
ncbi:MAG: glycosyltransferase family 39 protein [Planctomycetota bacterium]